MELILLHPEDGDDPSAFDTVEMTMPNLATGRIEKRHTLKHKPNGDCVYLGESGCTIYDRRPAICRSFDCRVFFLKFDSRQRKAMVRDNEGNRAMFAAAKARLHTLRIGRTD